MPLIILLSKLTHVIPNSLLLLIGRIFGLANSIFRSERFQGIYSSHWKAGFSATSAVIAYAYSIADDLLNLKYLTANPAKVDLVADLKSNTELETDRPVIIAIPHLAATLAIAKAASYKLTQGKRKVLIPVRGINDQDPKFKLWLFETISSPMCQFILIGGAMSKIDQEMKDNPIILSPLDMLNSNDDKYDHHIKFFGHQFSAPSGAAWMAQKYNCQLITGYAGSAHLDGHFDLLVDTEISLKDKQPEQVTQALFNQLEKYIKPHPNTWAPLDRLFG